MKTIRIGTLVALLLASVWALQMARAEQRENTPANENGKEQSNMADEKVIMLIEAKLQPQRRAELIEALRQYLPQVRAEPGVEAFYVTARKDDPNTIVFYEVYKSQAAQDFHLQQDFTKKFLATLKSTQAADRMRTSLVEPAAKMKSAGVSHLNCPIMVLACAPFALVPRVLRAPMTMMPRSFSRLTYSTA